LLCVPVHKAKLKPVDLPLYLVIKATNAVPGLSARIAVDPFFRHPERKLENNQKFSHSRESSQRLKRHFVQTIF